MYVCMHACMHACMYICMYIYIERFIHSSLYVCIKPLIFGDFHMEPEKGTFTDYCLL